MTTHGTTALARWAIVAAIVWHALAVLSHGWTEAAKERHGRDFASYFYALEVARDGGDPYDTEALAAKARGVRRSINPYFYPPPFLLAVAWIPAGTSLVDAYRWWFWLDEGALIVAWILLARWWRPLGPAVGWALAASIAALTAIPNNHVMGQANLVVLAAAVGGLTLAVPLDGDGPTRGRSLAGGALLGLACMAKMSPAFLVMWLMLRGRFWAVGGAVAAAIGSSLVALPWVDAETQLRFYAEVLPGFATGDYNGLEVDPSLFGNHSVPNWWIGLFPADEGVSTPARWLTRLTALVVVGICGWGFRGDGDAWTRAAQASAVMVAMLLVPVYTYEHHVIWAIPAFTLLVAGISCGRIGARWVIPVAAAWACWAFELAAIKDLALSVDHLAGQALRGLLQELKGGALGVAFVGTLVAGWRRG